MTKFNYVSKNAEFYPVTFRIYHLNAYGKNKGKVDPDSVHTVTLYRSVVVGNTESVGKVIERLKAMLGESSKFQLVAAKEADHERAARMKRDDLEVVSEILNNGNLPADPIITEVAPASTVLRPSKAA
jgi:hypothetical protein